MPAGFHQPTSNLESIVGIQFGIFSPDEIVKRSVVEVISQATYDGNEPKIGGLFDPRMGVLDNGKNCRSCGQTNHGCPGHFGHYRLARPVYFIQFLPMIRNVLRCVCIRCGKLLIEKANHPRITKRRGEARWKAVLEACSKVQRCGQETEDGCGTVRPKTFQVEGIARIVAEWDAIPSADTNVTKNVVKQPLEVEFVLRLFRQILDEDVDFMGLSRFWCRPDWMICTVLPIPPPQVRPSVVQDNNQRSEDDLTHKLFEIIKSNKKLQEQINKNGNRNMIDELTTLLQYHVATLVDNKIPGVAPSAQRGGRPLKSLQQRIGSKEGRVRYNIQGKRVEQSARSVITGDPNISIAEVGVPMKIAMNLTRPEMVTMYNRERLYKYVQNGADIFPGAKSVVRKDGRMISLKHVNTKEIVLYHGDTVNRHLMDGDIILFNRQPTLHRMSMMGHRVRVLPFNTFRLNVTVTRPYNADFDGDEMNAHIPQSYEATAELQEIASVPMQIIRPRDGTPVIGVVQDALAGAYLATRPNNLFTRREFMNMMMKNRRFQSLPTATKDPQTGADRYTGQQIVGSLLPPINIEMANSSYEADPQDYNKIMIREGLFSQGVVDKGIFNKAGKGIVHTIYNDYGPKEAVDFMDGLQNVVETYLIMKGFSVGISDLIADEETRKKMEVTIAEKKKEVDDMILQVHMDLFTNNSGKSNQEEFEAKTIGILNKATVDSGKIGVESLSNENRLMAMVRSGSKGDGTNVAQMIACVGQQAPEGRRIPYGFTDRTLPHYKMFDDGAEARGFVEGSFLRGLTPQEFFFHAMSGREGLIDTAVKTADTGYTQRQLIKAMEDLMTHHDGTVRDASGKIVQFRYGEDGVNSTKIEGINLPLGKLTEASIREKFGLEGVDVATILSAGTERGDDTEFLENLVEHLIQDRKMLVEGVFGSGRSVGLFAPLNVERLLMNFRIRFSLDKTQPTGLTPLKVLTDIESIILRTQPENKIWCASLRFHLAPHKIVVAERFTVEAWDALVQAIVLKNWKSWAPPGELVGIVAAQSIGEPATQMSIDKNSFIVVHSERNPYAGPAGPYIDKLLQNNSSVKTIGEQSVVLDLDADMFILGVSNNENTSWRRISQVSRHPANGGLVEVHTRSGRKTTATLSHSFLKRSTAGIVPVLGSELTVGMRIPVAKSIPIVPNPTTFVKQGDTTFVLDKEFGWVCGIYLADGSLTGHSVRITKIAPIVGVKLAEFAKQYSAEFSERYYKGAYGPGKDNNLKHKDLKDFLLTTFGEGSYTKKVGALAYYAPLEFIEGLIGGFFDGDGNVNAIRQQIRASSRSKELLQGINRLLGYCSMFGVLSEEESIRIPGKVQYTLSIPRKYAQHYQSTIGFELPEKATALAEVIMYNEREDSHNQQEMIDKIPELGGIIAKTGKLLKMPGQSRTYGRWVKKESIGRRTLEEYIDNFKDMMKVHVDPIVLQEVTTNIALMESALNSDVLWDEIVELVYLEDPKTFVYDFTVPGNDSFMVDDNILVHNTLNTFHQAGVAAKSAMTRGVPRLKELLKVTKNPKANSLTIALKPAFRGNKEHVREVVQDLELTLLKDIVLKSAIYYDPDDEATILEEDKDIIKFFTEMELRNGTGACGPVDGKKPAEPVNYSKWLIRLEFDREKMFNKNITMDDVYFVIHNAHGYYGELDNNIKTIYSDYNSNKLIMRIRPKLDQYVYGDHLSSIKKFQSILLNNTIVRGIHGIRSVTWRKDNSRVEEVNGVYEELTQYILDTDGTNFVAIMNHPAVDGDKLYSTNVHDIYEQLGIEATRATLYSEINSLFGEADINFRHLGLLCDTMTHAGRLMSADRYGINKMDTGPLAKACFEETEKILLRAALFGEMDPVTGVSANIMTGQPIRAGTGFTHILLDEAALPGLMKDLAPIPEDEEEIEGVGQDALNAELYERDEDVCSQLQTQMNMTLPNAGTNLEDEEEIEIVALG